MIRKAVWLLWWAGIAFSGRAQQTLTLLFAGDAMQHARQLESAGKNGEYDFSPSFGLVRDEISSADLAVVNLEAPLGGPPYRGYPMFCAPDAFAEALKETGFDVFLTANNHILDRFSSGVIRTLRRLDSLQVYHTGSFYDERQRISYYPLMVWHKGFRLAFLNYTYGTNGMKAASPVLINYIDWKSIRDDVIKARHLGADAIIACMHWGIEYDLLPAKEQRTLADSLLAQGVKLVIGSHPHVVQPMELRRDSTGRATGIVAYSLGNFISAMKTRYTVGGALLKITLRKEGYEVFIDSAAYSLVIVRPPLSSGDDRFMLVPPSYFYQTDSLVPVAGTWPGSYVQDVRKFLNKHNKEIPEYCF